MMYLNKNYLIYIIKINEKIHIKLVLYGFFNYICKYKSMFLVDIMNNKKNNNGKKPTNRK